VGLLTSLKGTDLDRRLEREGRLLTVGSGTNDVIGLNFVPTLDREVLIDGYKRVLTTLYDRTLRNFYDRCLTMMGNLAPTPRTGKKAGFTEYRAAFRSFRKQLFSRQGYRYARFLLAVIRRHPRMFPLAVRLSIKGYHLERITSRMMQVEKYKAFLALQLERLMALLRDLKEGVKRRAVRKALKAYRKAVARYRRLDKGFRRGAKEALLDFRESLRALLRPAGVDTDALLALPERV